MPIQTDRLVLRCFTGSDFQRVRELDSHPAVLRFRSRNPISPAMTREFLERAQRSVHDLPRIFYAYAVILREGAHWLGQCGLTATTLEGGEAFLWYALLPQYWGRGYMPEAVRALLQVGAAEFKLQRIFAECHPDNLASVRVMEKAGMRYEKRYQLPGARGGRVERVRYSLEGEELRRLTTKNLVVEPSL